jgi:hypothetical protein
MEKKKGKVENWQMTQISALQQEQRLIAEVHEPRGGRIG